MKSAVIISDMRLFSLLTAIQLARDSEGDCIVSSLFLTNNDYGSFTNKYYKKIKLFFLSLLFRRVIIIEASASSADKVSGKVYHTIGIVSSLISITKDSRATTEKYPLVARQLEQLERGAEDVARFLEKNDYKKVFLFNGRFASTYSIVARMKIIGIQLYYFEWGSIPFHFILKNYPTHDFETDGRRTIACYENGILLPSFIKYEASKCGYVKYKLENSFSKAYSKINTKPVDVLICLGSQHEYLSLDMFDNIDDLEFVRRVYAKYGRERKYSIRAHPNQIQDRSWRSNSDQIKEFAATIDATYYDPEDSTDTHGLLERAAVCVALHSSISIDAFILGTPVDIFVRNKYSEFIDYIEKKSSSGSRLEILAQIMTISNLINHYPLAPQLCIIYKLLVHIDNIFTKVTDIKDAKAYDSWYLL